MPDRRNITNYDVIWYDDDSGHLRKRNKKLSILIDSDGAVATGVINGCIQNRHFSALTPIADIVRSIWGSEHGYWVKEIS